jgi:hypothetical protein
MSNYRQSVTDFIRAGNHPMMKRTLCTTCCADFQISSRTKETTSRLAFSPPIFGRLGRHNPHVPWLHLKPPSLSAFDGPCNILKENKRRQRGMTAGRPSMIAIHPPGSMSPSCCST